MRGRSRRGLVRNQQVVVVLQQERGGESEITESKRKGEGESEPAESRLPLKGKYPHSQHMPANRQCRRGQGAPLTGCLCAERTGTWRRGSQ